MMTLTPGTPGNSKSRLPVAGKQFTTHLGRLFFIADSAYVEAKCLYKIIRHCIIIMIND